MSARRYLVARCVHACGAGLVLDAERALGSQRLPEGRSDRFRCRCGGREAEVAYRDQPEVSGEGLFLFA